MSTIRRVPGMVAIAALAIGVAGVGRAQSPPPAEQKQKPAAEKKTEPTPKPATEEAKKKGPGEGIEVHGHWTIEVKDPDGKVATHREFENSLVTNNPSLDGRALLSYLLTGSVVPGGFIIALTESVATGNQTIQILPPVYAGTTYFDCLPTGFLCSSTLTVAPTNPPIGFTLVGQYLNAPAGTITGVGTQVIYCGSPNATSPPLPLAPAACTIPLPPGYGSSSYYFTSATGQSVPVIAGQAISVSVVISFS